MEAELRFGGRDYLLSWRLGCSQFTQAAAQNFCRKSGMRSEVTSWRKQIRQLTADNRQLISDPWTPDYKFVLCVFRAVSLDSEAKQRHFLGLVARDSQRFFWTGGRVRGGNQLTTAVRS